MEFLTIYVSKPKRFREICGLATDVFGDDLLSIISYKNLMIIVAAWIVVMAIQFGYGKFKQTYIRSRVVDPVD